MLPTFVIGLREGLEAALIVGIIAAFLRKQGRLDLLRQVWLGVGAAVALCVAAGLGLELVSADLPQRQQEGLETVIGVLAVGMVTYMVVWMKRHSRDLKGQLEGLAADALGESTGTGLRGAGLAMVLMAFLAVLREGLETVVFLLAAFNEAASGPLALVGAVVGIAVSAALGYGIYRGGVRINLSRFFRATGLILVLVAAGLVVSALHTAHEAGWLQWGQTRVLDLSAVVRPGSVLSSLLTGMLGLQPFPVLVEVLGWLAYLVPVGLYVAWPPGRAVPRRTLRGVLAGVAAIGVVAAGILALSAPDAPDVRPTTTAATVASGTDSGSTSSLTATVRALTGGGLTLRTQSFWSGADGSGDDRAATTTLRLGADGTTTRDGLSLRRFRSQLPGSTAGLPRALSAERVATLNQGRLPLGVRPAQDSVPVSYSARRTVVALVEPTTGRVVDLTWTRTVTALARTDGGDQAPLATPVARGRVAMSEAAVDEATARAADDVAARADATTYRSLAWTALVLGLVAGVLAALLRRERRTPAAPAETTPPRRTGASVRTPARG